MKRPFAVIGFTVFLTIAFLFDKETGVTAAVLAAFTVALVVALFSKKLRLFSRKKGAEYSAPFKNIYLPATLRPSTSTVGAPKAVLPMALGRWQLLARAAIFFSSS